ncbi:GAF and ANTAR domain-containing protein [Terrabacter sp. BE26]|uniref:GAF and ANTAR domain-containing protein n=1 Tax=Terrabacter sp. BE26 TaxID=2898152 RepID=UPI0035BE37B3
MELGTAFGLRNSAQTLAAVARLAVERVPGADHASVTSFDGVRFRTVAATDDLARRADEIQYALGSGPCVDAIVEDTLYRPTDLGDDDRWPEFGARVSSQLGLRSMLSFRLGHENGDVVDGLNLYSAEVGAFDERAQLLGLMLATHGAMALAVTANQARVDNLHKALETNREIGVATGVLMAQHHVTQDQAFGLLRLASQDSNRKLRDVAADVVETGVLPAVQRRSPEPGDTPGGTPG